MTHFQILGAQGSFNGHFLGIGAVALLVGAIGRPG
jgi:hypothetical protein